jgi:hypothetical protein
MSRTKERKRIAKDPFHQQILEALGRLQGDQHQAFEACMADLLRDVFPGLVPVPGGNDAGMDGAVADGKGEPYPLVCTVGEDVARNLKDNLDAFLERGLSSRKVALATSRALTPQETRELFRLAREKEFTLLQVFERSALAFLLYRNTTWCKRLLRLTGAPSALSVVPLSRRRQVDIELRGRDEDIKWLRSTPGDRVVLGLPGSGKTYLFSSLIRSGWPALYLVSDDDTAIANAFREQDPGVVIVDDAHVEPERLVLLRRLRDEIQGEFEIVASAWPGPEAGADVIEALGGLPESRVHNLGLLPRARILEIFQDLDVRPRDEILRDLVSQAGNKPGLAVTIALLWRQGEWQKILDGTVLSRTLLSLFKGLTGVEVADVLAAFSLGGRRGMSLEAVAGFLEIPAREVWKLARDLSTGGVLSPVDTERLAIHPQVLRSALLRQIFFTGSPIRLNYRKLLPSAPSFAESVEEIMAARAYGAVISTADLHDLVLQSGSRRAWSTLAVMSEEEARWVLENYPGNLLDVASGLLRLTPREVIPRILERAAEPTKKTGGWSLPEQPMRILSSWVEDFWAGPEEWIRRRQMVARAAKEFLLGRGEKGTGVHAICIALSPQRLGDSLDPGRGDILTHSRRLLPTETLRQLEPIWDETKEVIQDIDSASCHHLVSLLWDWHHQRWAGSAEDAAEKRELMREFAGRVLRDLAALSQGSPGLHAHFGRLAEEFGISLELEQDEVFLLLYHHDLSPGLSDREAAQRERFKALASEWAQDDPEVVVQKIAFYEEEAKKSSGHMRNMSDFCWELANVVQDPVLWLDECLSQCLKSDLVGPFLERIVRDQREGWESLLNRSLDIEALKWQAATLVLTRPDPPPTLLERILNEFPDLSTLVEGRCLNRKVPLRTLSRLLRHSQWDIALAAAVGEWWAEPQGEVHEEVLPEWRSAILRSRTEEYRDTESNMSLQYSLGCILSGDASLALEWLRNRLRDPDLPRYFSEDSPFAHALRSLGKEQRLSLLQELEPVPIVSHMIPLLVREDVELYRQVLALSRLSDYHHLAPLAGLPQKPWSNLALAALQAGYDPAQIAEAAFEKSEAVVGSGIEYWEKWDLAFAEIEREGPPELQEVSWYGRKIAQEKLQGAKGMEKYIDIHGLIGGLIPHRSGR